MNCRYSDKLVLSIGLCLLELFVALGISKAFDRVWHAGLFQKLNFYGIAGLEVQKRLHKAVYFKISTKSEHLHDLLHF